MDPIDHHALDESRLYTPPDAEDEGIESQAAAYLRQSMDGRKSNPYHDNTIKGPKFLNKIPQNAQQVFGDGVNMRDRIDQIIMGDHYMISRDLIDRLVGQRSPSISKKRKSKNKHRRELSEDPTSALLAALHRPILSQKRSNKVSPKNRPFGNDGIRAVNSPYLQAQNAESKIFGQEEERQMALTQRRKKVKAPKKELPSNDNPYDGDFIAQHPPSIKTDDYHQAFESIQSIDNVNEEDMQLIYQEKTHQQSSPHPDNNTLYIREQQLSASIQSSQRSAIVKEEVHPVQTNQRMKIQQSAQSVIKPNRIVRATESQDYRVSKVDVRALPISIKQTASTKVQIQRGNTPNIKEAGTIMPLSKGYTNIVAAPAEQKRVTEVL